LDYYWGQRKKRLGEMEDESHLTKTTHIEKMLLDSKTGTIGVF
jgi:hypothetical protein